MPGRPADLALPPQTQALHWQDPADPAAFIRDPSLSDPLWLNRIEARLAAHVHAEAAGDPLFYDLGDETGIADLAAAVGFRFLPGLARRRCATWLSRSRTPRSPR